MRCLRTQSVWSTFISSGNHSYHSNHYTATILPLYGHYNSSTIIVPLYCHYNTATIIRPLYCHYTATIIRPLYGHYTSTIQPLYGHYTATIRPLYGHYTANIRPLYGNFNCIMPAVRECVRTSGRTLWTAFTWSCTVTEWLNSSSLLAWLVLRKLFYLHFTFISL